MMACGNSSGGGGNADADVDVDVDSDADTDADPCDQDGDGSLAPSCGGDDCNDAERAVHPGAPDVEIETETVDAAAETGWYTSMALGRHGEVGISYEDVSRGDLRVATLIDGVWTSESPDTEGTFGDRTSAAFDSAGALHVTYGDGTTSVVRHATNAGGAWAIDPVATGAIASSGRAVVVDSEDVVHVLYTTSAGVLTHAANAGGTWSNEEVDRFGFPGRAALAIDGAGALHAAYGASNAGHYATNASGAWTTSTVTGGEQTSNVGLGVEASGTPHVVYWDFDTQSIRERVGPGFAMTEVYPGFGEADELSVATDEGGAVHVCVAKEAPDGTADLVYLTDARGPWEVITLDTGTTGYYCSIAAMGGAVHVSYFDADRGILRHALFGVPDGVDSNCDGDMEGAPRTPTSGIDGGRALGDLTAAQWQTFCEWSATFQGGEGVVHECPSGSVTVATVAECVDDSAAFADCVTVTVSQAETCIRAMGDDPCNGFSDPACVAMLACATG
jgi:hypothetical protein